MFRNFQGNLWYRLELSKESTEKFPSGLSEQKVSIVTFLEDMTSGLASVAAEIFKISRELEKAILNKF